MPVFILINRPVVRCVVQFIATVSCRPIAAFRDRYQPGMQPDQQQSQDIEVGKSVEQLAAIRLAMIFLNSFY